MGLIAKRFYLISVGFAMFSMFFGAGNVVFPLIVGQVAQDRSLFALLGLVITAVGVPFIGLLGMILFDGDYRAFFDKLGKVPGFIIIVMIMGLIGPFGAIPRCITLSYSTWKMLFPETSLVVFSISALIVTFFLTIQKNKITEILGGILTPALLASLGFIIIKGLMHHPEVPIADITDIKAFSMGLKAGYQTMDLLGSFFFCAVVIGALKTVSDKQSLFKNAMIASMIGASLLGVVYVGMSLVASYHSAVLVDAPHDIILGTIALHILGPGAGIVTCITVILACLTTAVALSSVFAEFIHIDILKNSISYGWSLILTLLAAFLVSTLEFQGIVAFLAPIIQLIYPSLLMLSAVNIWDKLWGFEFVKPVVLVTFILSVCFHFLG